MARQSKRQRRTGTKMMRMNLSLPDEIITKIRAMAGPLADNAFVEELTRREWRRREKRALSAQITEKSC